MVQKDSKMENGNFEPNYGMVILYMSGFLKLKMKHKDAGKTLEQHFLKEFKATYKSLISDSELKQQNVV